MKGKEEKYLGVVIHDTLTTERHIRGISGLTYKMLTNINVVYH